MPTALSAAAIETRLNQILDAVLSSRRSAGALARALAAFTRAEQELILTWTDAAAKTNAELAYQLARHAPAALRALPRAAVEPWIVHAIDIYDRDGLHPACAALTEIDAFATSAANAAASVAFEDVAGTLALFLRGLSGRGLKLAIGDRSYTDTETLFLPARVQTSPARTDNVLLYRALAAHLWAQTWYGTFRADVLHRFRAARFAQPGKALALFEALETIRLDARLKAELPGLHRDMQTLAVKTGTGRYPETWAAARKRLARADASALDSVELVAALYDAELPARRCYQARFDLERSEHALRARIEREKHKFRAALARLAPASDANEHAQPPRFELERTHDADTPGGVRLTLRFNSAAVSLPADTRRLLGSIVQDLGDMPDEYLIAEAAPIAADAASTTSRADEPFRYHEWDYRRRHYRKHWCALREIDVPALDDPFVPRTLEKYRRLLARLRTTFEAMRGEDRPVKKQPDGDDVDFDALVEAHADMARGRELSQRLFVQRRRRERDIAVLFLVDMSGSTKGWINDAEREALVLLCEALEVLGDRYAIYGFSGLTRERCECYRVKRIDEPYSALVRARIAGMRAQEYTRMGAVIRHVTMLLRGVEARTKLLVTLSDGKPDDSDGYRGEYGIEDTRAALLEAKQAGVHPFCITIDTEARAYLPHMYGPVNYAVVDDIRKLPLTVSGIYRRLTL